jgi:putative oxidoreductase
LAQVQLSDGTWVEFHNHIPKEAFIWPENLLQSLSILFLLVSSLALLAVRLVIRPLSLLANTAQALGNDINRPAMVTSGPNEVRRAAEALNTKQGRWPCLRLLKTSMIYKLKGDGLMKAEKRLPLVLLLMRLGIFIVMFIWTVDKFIRPEHAAKVFNKFYHLADLSPLIMQGMGVLELVILLAFLVGYKKQMTYGVVLLLHGISTLSSYKQYLTPFESSHLLFFAALPMLAACYGLYALKDLDTLWTVEKRQ